MRIWQRMKTKWGVLLLALVMLLCTAVTAGAASYPYTGMVNGATNMRSTANSYASNVIRRIPEGDLVEVIGEAGNFYRIEYDGRTGFVFKQYVEKAKATTSTSSGLTAEGYPYATVTTSSVNLRKSASTSAKKLDTIPKGARITVHSLSGSWANVTYSGQTGWVMKDYIQVATIAAPTPAPAPGNNNAVIGEMDGYQLLQSGSDGNQVIALQEALIELGFLKGSADGVYGSATAKAVTAFQKKNSLPTTGYADANLQAMLFSGKPYNSKGVKTEVKTLPVLNGLTMRSGDKGVLVRTMQSVLFAKGYYTGEITGNYDSATVAAVKAFQKQNGLKADGICGAETQELLYGDGISAGATATPKPSPSPTPLPELVKPTSTVRKGSKGNDARLVQQRLIDLKYLAGKADGIFGDKSVAALEAFQTKNNLVADGVAGSGTNAVLFSWLCLAADEFPSTPTLPPVTSTPEEDVEITRDNVVTIKQGVTGPEVLRLQKRLEKLGYYTSSKDSKCEKDDVAAIRLFQTKNGLTADGIAGYDTQVRLYADSAIMYNGQTAGSLDVVYITLEKGMKGDDVKKLQTRLIELGYLSGTPDGVFGTNTAEAVYHFQKKNGLVRDSIAGEETQRLLYSTSAVANTTVELPSVDISADILRKGDKNDSVKVMQEKLIAMGYLSGTADGVFGNLTYKALKEFQKANALYADGVAGKDTIAALNGADNAPIIGGTVTSPEDAVALMARKVQYDYWYATVRNEARKYPYCTIYDPDSGISWQVHMFSFGKHAEIEPLTPGDTEKMNQVCGTKKWTPKPVWVIFADGTIRIATTHSVPHGVQHRTDNNFSGHACLHFPRTQAQVTAIGPYATKHQAAVDKAWAELQASLD